jgi:hypothetical protein
VGARFLHTTFVYLSLTCDRDEKAFLLYHGFHQKYEGIAANLFYNVLNVYERIYNPAQHYGWSIAILQSSATGKSRIVYELGEKVGGLASTST